MDELTAKGYMRESMYPCAVPMLLIPKKDGSWGMSVDFRAVHNITVKYHHPVPRLDDRLDELHGACLFSSEYGLYKWLIIPLELTDAHGTLMRLMNHILRAFIGSFRVVHFDGILVYSKSLDEHIYHLHSVFDVVDRKESLSANIKRCTFCMERVVFLGYVASAKGIEVSEETVKAIKEWPTPKSITQVRNFHGLARQFGKDFNTVAAPLTEVVNKSIGFKWGDEQENKCSIIKENLSSGPLLALTNFTKVFCDVSGIGIGAILLQGKRPIARSSDKLNGAMDLLGEYKQGLCYI